MLKGAKQRNQSFFDQQISNYLTNNRLRLRLDWVLASSFNRDCFLASSFFTHLYKHVVLSTNWVGGVEMAHGNRLSGL